MWDDDKQKRFDQMKKDDCFNDFFVFHETPMGETRVTHIPSGMVSTAPTKELAMSHMALTLAIFLELIGD